MYEKTSDECLRNDQTNSTEAEELLVDWVSEDEVKLIEVKPTEEFKDVSTVLDSPTTLKPKISCRWNMHSISDSCRPFSLETRSPTPIPQNRISGGNEIAIFDLTDFDLMFNDPKYYELDTPPMNPMTNVSSDFVLTDIPFEAVQEISSISSWDTLDFLNAEDSDYSSTRVLNTGFNGLRDKPDIAQLFRSKREIFDARMKRRESEIWSIPEVRQLQEVLKQTVMWPVAMLLVTYAAPNNWVSCFFCGGFIETHCCMRSYKIVHGICFQC